MYANCVFYKIKHIYLFMVTNSCKCFSDKAAIISKGLDLRGGGPPANEETNNRYICSDFLLDGNRRKEIISKFDFETNRFW